MKPKKIDTEAIRAQAINILMALKTRQELEGALSVLNQFQLQEVVGYEEDGSPVTKQMILADYHQDWEDHKVGKTISNEAMMKWLEEECGTAIQA